MSFEHASDAGNSPAMDAGGQTDCNCSIKNIILVDSDI